MLVDLGLAEAIKSLALHSSIRVELRELPSERLKASAETVGYYVVAEAAGGTMELDSPPGGGTRIQVAIPLPAASSGAFIPSGG